MMRSLLIVVGFALMFLLGVMTGHAIATPRLQLTIRPQVMLQRGDVDVKVRLQPSAEHRILKVEWDSTVGQAGSRTFESLEGEHAPRLFQWWEKNYPPGSYVFQATVYDSRGQVLGIDRKEIRTVEDP